MVVERVSIKKVYVGKAMIFGLWFGAILGILAAAFSALMIALTIGFVSTILGYLNIPVDSVVLYAYALVLIPLFAFVSAIGAGVFALIYNLVSVLKGDVHFGMFDIAPEVEVRAYDNKRV